ncbi:hypothetical protein CDD80_2021 [Ophiocordyceps camponoti-rufipedis]|uniref:TauD/TfdA-like domain-containing protein n=1 Tax=Ophiocordyceps camponoti-rufipedis TaxID=2004952 RepID=A0A2C5Z788_9HYPO|nr:hypothetical protein CDD80_2021 [Ophiocordyceps camponoti-rufipedis]
MSFPWTHLQNRGRDLPKPRTGPLVWSGSDFESEASYTLRFDKNDMDEIDDALGKFLSAESIHKGCGFVVFRGIDPSRYSILQNVIIFLGLAGYVGDKRGLQDKSGNVLALQVRQGVESGGCTSLSSAAAVLNHLLLHEPSLAETLLRPDWPVQIYGEQSRYYLAPVFAIRDGNLLASMDPHRLGPHPASPDEDIPPLTVTQRLALNRVAEIARQTELKLKLETGDLVFINNWAVLHRREAYQDDDCPSRHLVRLWLRNTQLGWSIPQQMLPPWRAAFEDEPTVEMMYPLHPPDTYTVPRYATGSAAFVMEDARRTDEPEGREA